MTQETEVIQAERVAISARGEEVDVSAKAQRRRFTAEYNAAFCRRPMAAPSAANWERRPGARACIRRTWPLGEPLEREVSSWGSRRRSVAPRRRRVIRETAESPSSSAKSDSCRRASANPRQG